MAQRRQVLQGRDAGRHSGRLRHRLDDSGLMDARSEAGSRRGLNPPAAGRALNMTRQSYHLWRVVTHVSAYNVSDATD